jgi:membrane protease YdiL (CAAX protease family)
LNVKIKYILKSILFCIVFTGIFVIFSLAKSFIPQKFERIVHGIIGTIAALLTTFLFLKIDKKSFADIGLKFEGTTIKKFFIGIIAGIGIMGLMTISVIIYSDFKIELNKDSSILKFLFFSLPLIPLAFMEEVGFRAYPLTVLKEKSGLLMSILITSILFGFYHIANGWTIQNSFLGPGVWGIIYASAAIYSNGISMSTGLHYAANLTTSAFGITSKSFNIWVFRQKNGLPLENSHSSQLAMLIPQISLLIFGIFCICWLVKNKK